MILKKQIAASFNQDNKYFIIGTEKGFKIYDTEELKCGIEKDFDCFYSNIQLLYKTNIVGLVGSYHHSEETEEEKKKYNAKYLSIWDNYENKKLAEINFKEDIISLKMRKDNFYVVCRTKIHIFNIKSFNMMDTIETYDNPLGLLGINYSMEEIPIICFPEKESGKGFIKIKKYDEEKTTFSIKAHESDLACITISYDGKLLATASENGQKIRVFDILNKEMLQELHRGEEKTPINNIVISLDNNFLAASSNNVIHIWSLLESIEKLIKKGIITNVKNNLKKVGNVKSFLGYFGLNNFQWCLAQVKVKVPFITFSFGIDNTINIITCDGKFLRANIDYKKGGEYDTTSEDNLI